MNLWDARQAFFKDANLGDDGGYSASWVRVEFKPFPLYCPLRGGYAMAAFIAALVALPSGGIAQGTDRPNVRAPWIAAFAGFGTERTRCPTCPAQVVARSGYSTGLSLGYWLGSSWGIALDGRRWSYFDFVDEVDRNSRYSLLSATARNQRLPHVFARLGAGTSRHWGKDDSLSARSTIVGAGVAFTCTRHRSGCPFAALDYIYSLRGTRDPVPTFNIREGPFRIRALLISAGFSLDWARRR